MGENFFKISKLCLGVCFAYVVPKIRKRFSELFLIKYTKEKNMKKLFVSVLALLSLSLGVFAFGCKKPVKLDGDYVVITAQSVEDCDTLLAYMEKLQRDGKLSFTVTNGMVTAIDGKANDADYNPCWMLYTSDAENANGAWGTVEYDGKQYGSATLGAGELPVKENCVYIWWYQSF